MLTTHTARHFPFISAFRTHPPSAPDPLHLAPSSIGMHLWVTLYIGAVVLRLGRQKGSCFPRRHLSTHPRCWQRRWRRGRASTALETFRTTRCELELLIPSHHRSTRTSTYNWRSMGDILAYVFAGSITPTWIIIGMLGLGRGWGLGGPDRGELTPFDDPGICALIPSLFSRRYPALWTFRLCNDFLSKWTGPSTGDNWNFRNATGNVSIARGLITVRWM